MLYWDFFWNHKIIGSPTQPEPCVITFLTGYIHIVKVSGNCYLFQYTHTFMLIGRNFPHYLYLLTVTVIYPIIHTYVYLYTYCVTHIHTHLFLLAGTVICPIKCTYAFTASYWQKLFSAPLHKSQSLIRGTNIWIHYTYWQQLWWPPLYTHTFSATSILSHSQHVHSPFPTHNVYQCPIVP